MDAVIRSLFLTTSHITLTIMLIIKTSRNEAGTAPPRRHTGLSPHFRNKSEIPESRAYNGLDKCVIETVFYLIRYTAKYTMRTCIL